MIKREDSFGSIVIFMDIQKRKIVSSMVVILQLTGAFSVGLSSGFFQEYLRRKLIYSTIKIVDSKLNLIKLGRVELSPGNNL